MGAYDLDAYTVALRAWLEDVTDRPCHDSQGPPEYPGPYSVLYQLTPGWVQAPVGAGPASVLVLYQVTSVAKIPSQARSLGDRVRRFMLGDDLPAVDGWVPAGVTEPGDGAIDKVGALWNWAERFPTLLGVATTTV